jgi:hypothetical protein
MFSAARYAPYDIADLSASLGPNCQNGMVSRVASEPRSIYQLELVPAMSWVTEENDPKTDTSLTLTRFATTTNALYSERPPVIIPLMTLMNDRECIKFQEEPAV